MNTKKQDGDRQSSDMKNCEVCGSEIPKDFVNLLCLQCYETQALEQQTKKLQDEEERATLQREQEKQTTQPLPPSEPSGPAPASTPSLSHGILDPNYKTNPEAEDKDQVLANLAQFVYSKKLLWYPTREMYTYIKNYCIERIVKHPQYEDGKYIWKPHIVDVGCGSGVGSNVLSEEASFVWGIDKNELSIRFAREAFQRIKNGIYYTPQLTFDVFDMMKDTREVMKFDLVVAVEIVEHVEDASGFIMKLIERFAKHDKRRRYLSPEDGGTEFFISTPNRNNAKIKKDQPQNPFHIREWTAQEFHGLLKQFFERVDLTNTKGEPASIETDVTPILARCSVPRQ